MSPRTGRPPSDNPKSIETRVRMTEADREKLDFAAKILKLPKSEVIRQGINVMYEKAKQQEK